MFPTQRAIRLLILTVVALSCAGLLEADSDSVGGTWAWTDHFQATVVPQGHPGFSAPYSGMNSLGDTPALDTSLTSTLFLGLRLLPGFELYFNPELQAGSGFNGTTGLADFPNGEIYRVSSPYPALNLSRLYVQWVIGLGGGTEGIEDDANQIAGSRAVSRLTLVAGKFSLNDYFDDNTYSHDPRSQFLNWALMDLGAWDYAADTRGYTEGIYAEFNQASWAVRFAEVLEPKEANGEAMDLDVLHAHSENLEIESRWSGATQPGKLRLLAFCNHADMGSYRATLDSPSDGEDISDTQAVGRIKYGFGLNLEQSLSKNLGIFSRISWNDGQTETWAFTEIDRSGSVGFQWNGESWRRPLDHAGLAYIISGLSPEHEEYLAAGGYGFIIGDGALNYAPEQVLEAYYSLGIFKGLTASPDYQFFRNPAYNQDRGPVHVFSLRVHYEI
jgi:high affinity Mn2+ porin